jgi:hypothetical protein
MYIDLNYFHSRVILEIRNEHLGVKQHTTKSIYLSLSVCVSK